MTNFKKANCDLKAGVVNPNFVTADSPIPFSARKLWHEMNWWLNGTFSNANKDDQSRATAQEINNGDCESLIPAQFTPYPPNNSAPFKSKHQEFYSYEK